MTDISIAIPIPYDEIRAFCERNHIRRLALFGSVLREDFRAGGDDPSEVGVLVTSEPGFVPGWEDYTWGDELAALFGRTTDSRCYPCRKAQSPGAWLPFRELGHRVGDFDGANSRTD